MNEEKTEQPTAKRLRQFREEGRVAKSQELGGIIMLFAGVYLLTLSLPRISNSLTDVMRSSYIEVGKVSAETLTYSVLKESIGRSLLNTGLAMAPWLGTLMAIGLVANLAQTKGLVQPRLLIPKWERLNPLNRAKQMFGKQLLVETLKGIAKQTAIVLVVYFTLSGQLSRLMESAQLGIGAGVASLSNVAYTMAPQASVVLLLIAVFDYIWQYRQHRQSLMMTKQEVKDESKQQEGSPEVKGRIRRIQREMSQRRMMQAVPRADAVVVNPTHYAAAIRYDAGTMDAPELIAKGKDDVALKIISIARHNGIPVVPNKPLARALYKLPLNATVPQELFQALAEVLAFVYNLKNRVNT